MNRKQFYSSSDRTNTQYKITTIPIIRDLDKEQQKYQLNPSNYLSIVKEINFSKKISQKSVDNFLCSNIFNIGLLKDKTQSLTKDNVRQTDFLFLDFEESKKETLKKVLSFDECIKILKENNLNYILKTSFNHSNKNPRLHLFLPLLKPIKSDEEYKYNLRLVQEKYFSEYQFDNSTKNISRWTFSSKSDTLKYSYNFENDDIEPEQLDERLLTVVNQTQQHNVPVNNEIIKIFNRQVQSMYEFQYSRYDSDGVIKYYRDKNDKTPNLWYSTSYYENCDKYTIYDKNEMYNVLFSYDDFEKSINPQQERMQIQQQMKTELNNWFIDGGKNYIVTNEGLGKSSTVLDFGKDNNFVYVCHSRSRINEVSKVLDTHNIKYKVIFGNEDLLKELNEYELSEKYSNLFIGNNDRDESFKKFIENNVDDDIRKQIILQEHKHNSNSLITDDCVRLVTSKKLSIEIYKENFQGNNSNDWHTNQKIIFDEFNFGEWSSWRKAMVGENSLPFDTIWNKDDYIQMEGNKHSFSKLLKYSNNVLILTTERSLIQPLFYKTEYTEIYYQGNEKLSSNIWDNIKFEKKLYDESVIYILTKSTKKGDYRDTIIQNVKNWFKNTYNEEIDTISDGTTLRDVSHLGVKGSNEYDDKNLLIIGTFRTEIEDNIFYQSCKEYLDNYLDDKKQIQNFIKSVHLQSQVSQSIGRNSGFRNQHNKKTVVVLPLLDGNRQHNFKHIDLNYVSSNVLIQLDFGDEGLVSK